MLARLISPPSFNPCLEFSNRNKFNRLNLPRAINKNSAPKRVKIYTARSTLTPLNNFYVSATSLHIPNNTILAQSIIIRYGSLSPFPLPKISLAECTFALQSKLKFTLRRPAAWLLNFYFAASIFRKFQILRFAYCGRNTYFKILHFEGI